jgi:hypothetical protein
MGLNIGLYLWMSAASLFSENKSSAWNGSGSTQPPPSTEESYKNNKCQ